MAASAARPNKNWLLIKFREWHTWGGVLLSGFILVVAVTGIILNHKDLFLRGGKPHDKPVGALTTTTDLQAVPVGFAQAMDLGRTRFGEVPLEKIELKDENGRLVYKLKGLDGSEIIVDAMTAEITEKTLYRYGGGINWGKLIDDLHTGKIAGTPGKLMVDLTSGVMIALTLTGLYLWWIPIYRKRQSAAQRRRLAEDRGEF
jgi:hypothetical protein